MIEKIKEVKINKEQIITNIISILSLVVTAYLVAHFGTMNID